MISKSEDVINFIKDFEEIGEKNNNDPTWLKSIRSTNYERISKLGIPTVKNEEWKYTSLASLVKERFELSDNPDLKNIAALKKYIDNDALTMVFVNGNFAPKLSNLERLPKGIVVQTIREALKTNNGLIEQTFKKFDQKEEAKPFVALNKYGMQDGYVVTIADKVVTKEFIHVVFITEAGKPLASFARNLIIAGKSCEGGILESHIGVNDSDVYFNNPLTEIYVSENAHLIYCKAQKESQKAFHISNARVIQERNSVFNGFNMTCGGNITRNDLDIQLRGEGCNGILNGLYSILGTQHVDNHTCVEHREPNCLSNQLYKGILNEGSRAIFNGKIIVDSIAQKTNSYQLNKNLLLGKNASVDTKPQLEISADDVKCTHGATIGQLNEDEMFYLQSRCISKKDATQMLAVGFVDDVLNHIPSKDIIKKLHYLLEPSLKAL